MKKYDSYKDSDIEWIGEIPEHWEPVKFNLFVEIRHGYQFMNHDFVDKGVKIVKITQLNKDGSLDLSKCSFVSPEQVNDKQSILIKEKDILMCLTGGTIGKIIRVGKVNEPLLQNYRVGHFSSAITSRICDDYIFWTMSSDSLISQIFFQMRETGQPNIGMEDFGRMRITLPTLEEQTQIANYLDHKTIQIDDLVSKKEKLVELLKEERNSIINQVITRGLDPKVPMRIVDVDGLDEIPSQWRLLKFKWIAPILTCGVASTPEYVDSSEGMPFLSAQNVKNNKMRLDKYKYIPHELHEKLTKHRKPENGDILVTRVGAGIGDACIVDCDFEFSVYVSLTHIRVDTSAVSNKFIMYFFSTDYCKYLNSQGTVTGGGVGNLNVNNVERYKLPVPSLEEQNEIVDYIEENNKKFDNLTSKLEKEITLLKEYKTALISEVVTGKVDVREEILN